MTFYETGHSTGDISLSALFSDSTPRAADLGLTIREVIDRLSASVAGLPSPGFLQRRRSKLCALTSVQLLGPTSSRIDGICPDPEKVKRVLQSLARNVATHARIISLEQLMIIEDLPAWAPELRSRARLRSTKDLNFFFFGLPFESHVLTDSASD